MKRDNPFHHMNAVLKSSAIDCGGDKWWACAGQEKRGRILWWVLNPKLEVVASGSTMHDFGHALACAATMRDARLPGAHLRPTKRGAA